MHNLALLNSLILLDPLFQRQTWLGKKCEIIIKNIPNFITQFTEIKNIIKLDDLLALFKICRLPKIYISIYRTDGTISKVKFIQTIVSYCIKKPLYLKRGFLGD